MTVSTYGGGLSGGFARRREPSTQVAASSARPCGWRVRRVEVVLALAVGVAAFVLAAVVGTAARSHVPLWPSACSCSSQCWRSPFRRDPLRAAGGVVTILAFDWYFLPPLRKLDAATVLVLALFLVMAAIVAAFATETGRRATGSEQARGVLADEQTALRRVATLVARDGSPAEVFAAVSEEAGKLLSLDSAHLVVYDRMRRQLWSGAGARMARWRQSVRRCRCKVTTFWPG